MHERGKCRHCLAPECKAEPADRTENPEGEVISCKKYESPTLAGLLLILAMVNCGFWDVEGYSGVNLLVTGLLMAGAAAAYVWPILTGEDEQENG